MLADVAPMTLILARGPVEARIRVVEGGVVDDLRVHGRPVLTRTPWADMVVPAATPARSEADWVAHWRGGWQLCFPSTGLPDDADSTPQGFHGVASQAPWALVDVGDDHATVRWQDPDGLRAERTWRLTDDGLAASTTVVNGGDTDRRIAVAEHLILGGDVLAPLAAGAPLTLDVPTDSMLGPLDLTGRPNGMSTPWPGDRGDRWATVERTTPARVAALMGPEAEGDAADVADGRRVTLRGAHVRVTVTWWGLPHALLWEELTASPEPPWGGEVMALGIEPTSTPHGVGTAARDGIVHLQPGSRLDWRATLAVSWVAA